MGNFGNIELGTENTSSVNKIKNLRPFDMYNASTLSGQALRRIDRQEELDAVNESIMRKEKEDKINKRMDKVARYGLIESRINMKVNDIAAEAKDYVFKNIVFDIFENALVLDKPFVHENINTLKAVCDDVIDNEGGFAFLESVINKNDSVLLKRIKKLCESISNNIVGNILKEAKECEDCDELGFTMSPKDEKELDYGKGQIDVEKISELVKDKVLTVVQDEKEMQEKQDDIVKDIEEELTDDEDVKDEDSIKEAMNRIVANNNIIQESTLFGALMQDAYEEILSENVAINSSAQHQIHDDKQMSASYDVDSDSSEYEDVMNGDDETTIDDMNEYDPNLVLENKNITVDMDMVMAEALVKYTLMETMYTLKLKDYTYHDIEKFTNNIANRHISKSGPLTEAIGDKIKKPDIKKPDIKKPTIKKPEIKKPDVKNPFKKNDSKKKDDNKPKGKDDAEFDKARKEFYKHLNNLKNRTNEDDSKSALKKLFNTSNPSVKEKLKGLVDSGIDQMKRVKDKNPQSAKSYDGHISFLKSLK